MLGISPFETPDARLVAELCTAGAVGVLDLGAGDRRARRALDQTTRWTSGPFGVRLGEDCDFPIDELPDAVQLIVVPAGRAVPAGRRTFFVEVTDLDQARRAIAAGASGLIARGAEAGGRVGELTTFVLLQQLLAELDVPIWACGGIGPHTAAAAMAGGAAGVVLDTQLALLPSASPTREVEAALAAMDGSETTVLDGRRVLQPRAGGPALPVGQDGYLAAELAHRHRDVAGVVAAVRAAIADAQAPEAADTFAENSVLAGRLGTRLPVVQGPMTRVSDQPELAAAVAEAGGMPFLALALADADTTARMLDATAQRLGDRPWGAGILGFAPEETRAAQLAAIEQARPSAVIIAGGRPSQATALEAAGIAAFLHVPSPRLLGQFLATGARRFVFEGAECGGHIGPRSSFCLWQAQLLTLLDFLDREPGARVDVLFAGGVHDARSAAMVAALAAPLTARGVGVGVLMGTGYLFTREAVAGGAIGPVFQQQVLEARATAVLETALGHLTRGRGQPVRRRGSTRSGPSCGATGCPNARSGNGLEAAQRRPAADREQGPAPCRRRPGWSRWTRPPSSPTGCSWPARWRRCAREIITVAQLHHSVTEGAAELLRRVAPGRCQGSRPGGRSPRRRSMWPSSVWPGVFPGRRGHRRVLGERAGQRGLGGPRYRPTAGTPTSDCAERPDGERGGCPGGAGSCRASRSTRSRYGIPPAAMAWDRTGAPPRAGGGAPRAGRRRLRAERPFDRSRTAVVFGAESGGELSNAADAARDAAQLPGRGARRAGRAAAGSSPRTPSPVCWPTCFAGRIANRLDLGGSQLHGGRGLRLVAGRPGRGLPGAHRRHPPTWCCAGAPTPTTASTTTGCSARSAPSPRPGGAGCSRVSIRRSRSRGRCGWLVPGRDMRVWGAGLGALTVIFSRGYGRRRRSW